jgi:chaperone required for assembly of F1-ATPase
MTILKLTNLQIIEKYSVKRFYETVTVENLADDTGFAVALDGRQIKTPAKAVMASPTLNLAEAIATEWRSQGDNINPKAMPLNQLLNTSIDRVSSEFENIVDELVQYGGSDMLCYRADHPDDLVKRQGEAWGPYIDWMGVTLEAPMKVTSGIIHIQQSETTLEKLRSHIGKYTIFSLTTLHALTTGLGSLGLGLAYIEGFREFDDVWEDARVDERYQIEQWGEDADAKKITANLYEDLKHAVAFLQLVKA